MLYGGGGRSDRDLWNFWNIPHIEFKYAICQSCYDIYRDTSKPAIIVPFLGFFLASVEYRSFVKGIDIGRLRLVIKNIKRKKCPAGSNNEFELHDSP